MYLATIPFAGFHNSIHDDECDRALESIFQDDRGDMVAPSCVFDMARDAISWGDVYRAYAKEYAESFLQWLGLDGRFESMSSPREYNFQTDRVFVELTRADLTRLVRGVPVAAFDKACRDRFTSRSGFISHYSPNWRDWGRLSTWDHNQIGTLVQCFAEIEQGGDFDSWAEYALMEDSLCNGFPESAIWANASPKLEKAYRVNQYLMTRKGRAIKTLDQWHAARRAMNRPWSDTPLGSLA